MPSQPASRSPAREKLTFVKRRSGYYFKEPESGIERVFRKGDAWDPTPQRVQTWLSMCKSHDPKTRHEGLFALRRSGALAPQVADLASDALRDQAQNRAELKAKLPTAPRRRSSLVSALTQAFDPDDDLSGAELVRALRTLGDRSAVEPMRELLHQILERGGGGPAARLPKPRAQYALCVIDALLALGARHERDLLLEFLDHESDVIRSLALSILHDRAGPWSRPALRKVLDSDRPFHRRMRAAEALFGLGDRMAEEVIYEAADSRDPEVRRRAVPALALRHRPADVVRLEKIWEKEPFVEDRLELGVVLLERGRLSYRRVFWGPLNHPYPHVRLKAVRLLVTSKAAEARKLLSKAMEDEPDGFIRAEADLAAESGEGHARARA